MHYAGQHRHIGKTAFCLLFLCLVLIAFAMAFGVAVFPPLALLIVAGAAFTAICLHRPFVGFLIVLGLMPLDQLLILFPSPTTGSASAMNMLTVPKIMMVVLFPVWAMRVLLTKDEEPLSRLRLQAVFIQLCLLFLLGCLPCIAYAGLQGSVLSSMIRTVSNIAVAITGIAMIRNFRALYLVFATLLPTYTITAAMGIYEVLTQTYILELAGHPINEKYAANLNFGGGFRPMGPSGDAVYYAASLIVASVAALVVLQVTRRRLVLIACLACLGLFVIAMLSTASRGGLLAGVLLAGVFFVFAKFRHKWLLAGATVVACTAGLAIYTVAVSSVPAERFTGHSGADRGDTIRLGLWSVCMRMAEDSPLIGVGMGQFPPQLVKRYYDPRAPQQRYQPHNVYLQVLAETGLGALILYVALWVTCGVLLLGAILRTERTRERNVAAALLGGIVGLASFATNTNLRDNEWLWLMMAFGVIAANVCLVTSRRQAAQGAAV